MIKKRNKMLMEYTDYRNYLDYDIKIKYAREIMHIFLKSIKKIHEKHKHHSHMSLWQQVLNKLFRIETKTGFYVLLFLTKHLL